jgi:Uma2 family endonuclease
MMAEVAAARRPFTREEYHRMGEVGILTRSDRVELIRGEIITKSPQGRRHRAFIDNLNHLLITDLAGRAIVSVQMPIVLADDTEPQPDVQILRRRRVPYKDREADEHRGAPHASRRRLSRRDACRRPSRNNRSAGVPRRRAGAR